MATMTLNYILGTQCHAFLRIENQIFPPLLWAMEEWKWWGLWVGYEGLEQVFLARSCETLNSRVALSWLINQPVPARSHDSFISAWGTVDFGRDKAWWLLLAWWPEPAKHIRSDWIVVRAPNLDSSIWNCQWKNGWMVKNTNSDCDSSPAWHGWIWGGRMHGIDGCCNCSCGCCNWGCCNWGCWRWGCCNCGCCSGAGISWGCWSCGCCSCACCSFGEIGAPVANLPFKSWRSNHNHLEFRLPCMLESTSCSRLWWAITTTSSTCISVSPNKVSNRFQQVVSC